MPSTNIVRTRHPRLIERGMPAALAFQETKAARIGGGHAGQGLLIPGSGLFVRRQNRRTGRTLKGLEAGNRNIRSSSQALDAKKSAEHDQAK